jgi:transposase-like protein
MDCPECQSEQIVKNGKVRLQDQTAIQKYLCKACGRQFNERSGTAMSRLRTSATVVALALNVRAEGMGVRATGRCFGKSHGTIIKWEQRLAATAGNGSPPAPPDADVTVEADEMST